MKKSLITLVVVILTLGLAIIGLVIDKGSTEVMRAVIVGKDTACLRVKSDGEEYKVMTDEVGYEVGSVVEVYYKEVIDGEIEAKKIKYIGYDDAYRDSWEEEESSLNDREQGTILEDDEVSGEVYSSKTSYTEDEVISYLEELESEIKKNESKSITNQIKDGFVKVVDFLFYEGTIKGYTFSELSGETKVKVLYIALSIDEKIEEYFPGYKESLGEVSGKAYDRVKEQIIVSYLDTITRICESDEVLCEKAKIKFGELKEELRFTWSNIKNLARDATGDLASWYKIWKES